jgi:hypothetical protein
MITINMACNSTSVFSKDQVYVCNTDSKFQSSELCERFLQKLFLISIFASLIHLQSVSLASHYVGLMFNVTELCY